ncbi:putative ABC transport system permease protein [Chitinophaga sp. CF118]|uniref:ABC transporter permease n=1 Tax=Chitinophaga sp. CF118 TaxID=1884367 RepID=UPI0008E299B1|nr:FtsX-like permease family protein [Chitinophaga sp. CF118]SFD45598.1 putative ABC transport system permease protein [Chitinophaga sp. CF118]
MTLKLIIRNILYKPLSTVLSWILLLFGVAIISLLLVVQQQLEQKFSNDLQDVDLIIGAKGSPLQLVLSAIYHVDAPTGNISENEVNRIIHNPLIQQSIPLAYGDNFRGYCILGTDSSYIKKAQFARGKLFHQSMEAVLGSNVAATNNMDVGSTFIGTHGQGIHGHQHKGHYYKVVGILRPTGTVIDNLVITNIATIREIHEHHDDGDVDDHNEKQITAVLVKFRSPMGLMILPRMINETTNMQAASPVLEINRLVGLMGIGVITLQYIAIAIMIMAGLSVFISLFNRLHERKYEMALLRSLGYSRFRLFSIIMAEGLLLSVVGFISGIVVSRIGLLLLNNYASAEYHFNLQAFSFLNGEIVLLVVTLGIGIIASVFPALSVFKLNISKTLADE